jgi:preprotein translocase subunit YajC
MNSAMAVLLLLIVCFLVLGGGWFLIMRTEMKIEKKC